MADDELDRVSGDLAVLRQAMGLRVPFGRGAIAVDVALAVAAVAAAGLGLAPRADAAPIAPLVAVLVFPVAAYASRGSALAPEAVMQAALSVTIYTVVWVAAAGYAIAADVAPAVSSARTAALYATSIGLLLTFSALLVRGAVRRPDRYYCLGLALSTALAGMALPILGRPYLYAAAHTAMAVGFLAAAAIRWRQVRRAADVAD